MLVFETDQFVRESAEHSIRDHVLRTTKKIQEAGTRLEVVDCVGKYYQGLLVDRTQNFRLIGHIHRMNDGVDVFVWLRVLSRGGAEYGSFGRVADRIRSDLDHQALEEWYGAEKRLHEERARTPQLPSDLRPWLEPIREVAVSIDGGYLRVLESAEWVKGILETRREVWADVYAALRWVVEAIQSGEGAPIASVDRAYGREGSTGVEYYRPDALTIFLVRVVTSTEAEGREHQVQDLEGATRAARRSYPEWILLDRDQWFEIQDQKEANLSLSPEERNLLDAVAGFGVEEHRLPLFINGQAGSGKSTMLSYIFAGLLSHGHSNDLAGKSLYITYNEELLKRANKTTAHLLQHDAQFLSGEDSIAAGSFVTWRDFLVSLLPADKAERFNPENRIDFHEFRLAWEHRGGRLPRYDGTNRRSAEFVWFVIKALIKGSDSIEDLTPEDFTNLARRDQSIGLEEFEEIYEHVYLTWYASALRDGGLWDDQDLVSAVLAVLREDPRSARESSPDALVALVVDEAQDFTRRELRVLTRLLVYANFELPHFGTPIRLPVVLAGDPLQTLSPTGFDWSRIRAAMHEEFGLLFGPGAVVPDIEMLNYNYRSAEPIVRIGNTVQFWRDQLFEIDGIRAQTAWNPAVSPRNPEKFLFGQIREDDFIQFARDSVIVVPCDEGGERDFIANDETLSRMFQTDRDLTVEGFVFSPVAIKGLEFERVILYKFGDKSPEIYWTGSNASGQERSLEAEYFFNKLYVGVTRATEFLFIVDTDKGDERLWSHFTSESVRRLAHDTSDARRSSFLQGLSADDGNSPYELQAQLGHVEVGVELSDVQEQNPKAVADGIRRYGLETRNPTKLRQAASGYRRSANHELAVECEAHALRFEGRLLEAADLFERSQRFELSWECRWEHADWDGLAAIAERVPQAPALQRLAVQLMSTPNLTPRDLLVLHTGLRAVNELPRVTEKQWLSVFERLVSVQTSEMDELDEGELEEIVQSLDELFDRGFRQLGPLLARVLLGVGDADRALKVAERSSSRLDPSLAAEIADSTGFPAGLKTLAKARLFAEVVEIWEEHERPGGADWTEPVTAALLALKRHDDVIELYLDQESPRIAAELLLELCSSGDQRNDRNVEEVVTSLAASGALDEAFELLDNLYEIPIIKAALPRGVVLRSSAVVAWAVAQEERGWPDLDRHARDLLDSPANRMADTARRGNLRSDDFPAVLALVEQVLGRRAAIGLCGHFARNDIRPVEIRVFARERYLVLSGEEIDDLAAQSKTGARGNARDLARLRAERQAKAQEWGISSFKNLPTARRAKLGEESRKVTPKGERHGIAWEYDPVRHHVEVTKKSSWVVRYQLTRCEVELNVGIEPKWSNDGMTIDDDNLKIVVLSADPVSISFAQSNGEVEQLVLHRSTSRTRRVRQGSQKRETRDLRSHGGPIKAHKLARELGVSLPELNEKAEQLGMARRNGNKPFSASEAQRLRKKFR